MLRRGVELGAVGQRAAIVDLDDVRRLRDSGRLPGCSVLKTRPDAVLTAPGSCAACARNAGRLLLLRRRRRRLAPLLRARLQTAGRTPRRVLGLAARERRLEPLLEQPPSRPASGAAASPAAPTCSPITAPKRVDGLLVLAHPRGRGAKGAVKARPCGRLVLLLTAEGDQRHPDEQGARSHAVHTVSLPFRPAASRFSPPGLHPNGSMLSARAGRGNRARYNRSGRAESADGARAQRGLDVPRRLRRRRRCRGASLIGARRQAPPAAPAHHPRAAARRRPRAGGVRARAVRQPAAAARRLRGLAQHLEHDRPPRPAPAGHAAVPAVPRRPAPRPARRHRRAAAACVRLHRVRGRAGAARRGGLRARGGRGRALRRVLLRLAPRPRRERAPPRAAARGPRGRRWATRTLASTSSATAWAGWWCATTCATAAPSREPGRARALGGRTPRRQRRPGRDTERRAASPRWPRSSRASASASRTRRWPRRSSSACPRSTSCCHRRARGRSSTPRARLARRRPARPGDMGEVRLGAVRPGRERRSVRRARCSCARPSSGHGPSTRRCAGPPRRRARCRSTCSAATAC